MTDLRFNRWSHPSVILVATDLNDLSRLMPIAIEQAKDSGGRLILLHVLPTVAAISTDGTGLSYYESRGALEYADKALLPWCEDARRENVACDALVREGFPVQQIAAAARQFQADRVLLGTRSRSKLTKLLLGSVAEQVLRSVNLPVMTVGPEVHLPVDKCHDRIVLHATTLRETSRPSAALACQVSAAERARLVLLHVLLPIEGRGSQKSLPGVDASVLKELRLQAAQENIGRLAAETGSEAGGCIEPIVVHGNPAIEILAKADELQASLIVLGSTHRSALGELTHDRTVYQVLAHARCPVLTLRESAGEIAETQAEHLEALHQ